MSARYIKIGLWVVALVGAWELGRSYVVTNALFLFAADGVVPGTSIRLEPNQVFWVLGTMLAVAALLIFSTNIRRAFLFWFGSRTVTFDEPIELAPKLNKVKAVKVKTPKPVPVVIIKLPRKPSLLSRVGHYIDVSFIVASTLLVAYIRKHFPRIVEAIKRGGQTFVAKLRPVWQSLVSHMRLGRQKVRTYGIRMAIFICRQAIRFWRWLEPQLREFDRWLGVKYHQGLATARKNESIKSMLHVSQEARKVIALWRAEIYAVLSRVVEK
ncbi:MAG TPA: hypothetical protein VLH38_01075 [Patescibacteria group bacterium]|nr:hypothetical protein [Patescibacteria group bacterium]